MINLIVHYPINLPVIDIPNFKFTEALIDDDFNYRWKTLQPSMTQKDIRMQESILIKQLGGRILELR